MRVPLSWLTEYVDLPPGESARDIAARLIRAGLEVETVDYAGADIEGPLLVGDGDMFMACARRTDGTVSTLPVFPMPIPSSPPVPPMGINT